VEPFGRPREVQLIRERDERCHEQYVHPDV